MGRLKPYVEGHVLSASCRRRKAASARRAVLVAGFMCGTRWHRTPGVPARSGRAMVIIAIPSAQRIF